jgi:hypothetical protein
MEQRDKRVGVRPEYGPITRRLLSAAVETQAGTSSTVRATSGSYQIFVSGQPRSQKATGWHYQVRAETWVCAAVQHAIAGYVSRR